MGCDIQCEGLGAGGIHDEDLQDTQLRPYNRPDCDDTADQGSKYMQGGNVRSEGMYRLVNPEKVEADGACRSRGLCTMTRKTFPSRTVNVHSWAEPMSRGCPEGEQSVGEGDGTACTCGDSNSGANDASAERLQCSIDSYGCCQRRRTMDV